MINLALSFACSPSVRWKGGDATLVSAGGGSTGGSAECSRYTSPLRAEQVVDVSPLKEQKRGGGAARARARHARHARHARPAPPHPPRPPPPLPHPPVFIRMRSNPNRPRIILAPTFQAVIPGFPNEFWLSSLSKSTNRLFCTAPIHIDRAGSGSPA
jgi:hypothetical protein